MPHLQIGKSQLYYEREGTGSPLILLAGYGVELSIWNLLRKPLAAHFDLILLDNRGAGKTQCHSNDFTLENVAEDVIALIDQLSLHKPHLLGHSMGGAIAQTIALHYPERIAKVILAQTFIKITALSRAVLNTILHLRQQGVSLRLQAEVIMPWLFSNAFMNNPDLCHFFVDEVERQSSLLTLQGLEQQLKALIEFDSSTWHSQITSPTLICAAEEDLLAPLAQSQLLNRGIKHSRLHIFKDIGHMALIEKPEEFCKEILGFLA